MAEAIAPATLAGQAATQRCVRARRFGAAPRNGRALGAPTAPVDDESRGPPLFAAAPGFSPTVGRHYAKPPGEVGGGGGGNRTRVLRRITRASPSAVRFASARPHRSRGRVGVAGPAAVRGPRRAPAPPARGVTYLIAGSGAGTDPGCQRR